MSNAGGDPPEPPEANITDAYLVLGKRERKISDEWLGKMDSEFAELETEIFEELDNRREDA
jgi:hypothetical protein